LTNARLLPSPGCVFNLPALWRDDNIPVLEYRESPLLLACGLFFLLRPVAGVSRSPGTKKGTLVSRNSSDQTYSVTPAALLHLHVPRIQFEIPLSPLHTDPCLYFLKSCQPFPFSLSWGRFPGFVFVRHESQRPFFSSCIPFSSTCHLCLAPQSWKSCSSVLCSALSPFKWKLHY